MINKQKNTCHFRNSTDFILSKLLSIIYDLKRQYLFFVYLIITWACRIETDVCQTSD